MYNLRKQQQQLIFHKQIRKKIFKNTVENVNTPLKLKKVKLIKKIDY